jgi:hypothetical protein
VRSLEVRLEGIEKRLVEERVEARVREELEAAFDRLERHLTHDELHRVLRILASEGESPCVGLNRRLKRLEGLELDEKIATVEREMEILEAGGG